MTLNADESAAPAVTVLLVDDHPVVRAGLRAMLTDDRGVEVVAEASDGTEALALLKQWKTTGESVDLVLMDLQMGPGMDGVTAIKEMRAAGEETPVLVLTTYDSDADIIAAMSAGASGYMLKDAPPADIKAAVRAAATGASALSPQIAARLVQRIQSPAPQLSARELEILELLAQGKSNKELAAQLFISQATIKTHLVHIFDKLGAENRTAAIAIAIEQRIIRR
ncbi:response regulator transcription factor [Jonesiaceae bacterium BS-20]|uniref:Response regulator transcription factor n=1 Tax=Jonesiaceae bacterium BS-20 TaxID=3120821 RepID=A0AAU7DT17_9MICO